MADDGILQLVGVVLLLKMAAIRWEKARKRKLDHLRPAGNRSPHVFQRVRSVRFRDGHGKQRQSQVFPATRWDRQYPHKKSPIKTPVRIIVPTQRGKLTGAGGRLI